jgi:hypothetical protein
MPPNPHVLLLGGHSKVSLLLTLLLLSRSWRVTSVIRDPAQKADILEAGKSGPGKIDVLVESLEEVKSDGDAARVLENTKPDYVVWSAGRSCLCYFYNLILSRVFNTSLVSPNISKQEQEAKAAPTAQTPLTATPLGTSSRPP